jgi:capsular polysaccharide transport system permease protein
MKEPSVGNPAEIKPAAADSPKALRELPAAPPALDATRRAAAEEARDRRKQRGMALLKRFALFVLLPTALISGYSFAVAANQYESTALFTIHATDQRAGLGLESLIGLASASPTTRDTLAVRDFILSRDMLLSLNKDDRVLKHYKSAQADVLSRMDRDATFEEAFEYMQGKIDVSFDSNSSVLTLKVRAFSADFARTLGQDILSRSESFVNHLAERARADQTRLAHEELSRAEERLLKARKSLVQLQKERGELNPEQTAIAAMTIRTQLEAEMAKARAELAAQKSYMAADSPQVIATQEKVRALGAQAAGETLRLVNPRAEKGLNQSLADFEGVLVEKEFATRAYQSALTSLELARADAAQQHRYLVPVAQPSLPDEARYPRRILTTITAFFASLTVFGILSLLWASVREHAKI